VEVLRCTHLIIYENKMFPNSSRKITPSVKSPHWVRRRLACPKNPSLCFLPWVSYPELPK